MLFSDALIANANDLAKIDSEVSDVAATCQPPISLGDTLNDAQQEVGSYLLGIGQRFHGRWASAYNGPDYGVQSLFTESSNRPRYSLSQVVASDAEYPAIWTELKRYMVYVTLFNFYRDASRRPGNSRDRYAEKRDVYEKEIRNKYLPRLIKAGLGLVGRPMACPGALFEARAGTWNADNLSLISGGPSSSTQAYDVGITWLDSTASQNNESAPSSVATISVTTGKQISVSISNLVAPNGQYNVASIARIAIVPLTATHWNVYSGVSGGTLSLQNISPIPYATKTYTLAMPATTTGAQMGVGQYPELNITLNPNQIQRG